MNKIPLILIGGGGHCSSCIDVINLEGKYSIEGILDNDQKKGELFKGYSILGNDELMGELAKKKYQFLITVGQIKSADVRLKIFEQLKMLGATLATVISPKAYVSPDSNPGEGTIVLHGSVINAGTKLGVNNIFNSMSLIEHGAIVGDHVHISTGAIVNGGCTVGNKSFIGSASILVNNISIGEGVVIGAGSVVIKDVMECGVYAGNPCKRMKG